MKNTSPRTKRLLLLSATLATLGLQACRWDDSLYERYVYTDEHKEDRVTSCPGYTLLSLKGGTYIRQLRNNNEIQWACGDYKTVVINKPTEPSKICTFDDEKDCCTKDNIELATDAMDRELCPKDAHNCVELMIDNTKTDEFYCSVCETGDINGDCIIDKDKCDGAICLVDGQQQCIDIQNNPQHCGSCYHDCSLEDDSPDRCFNGMCQSSKSVQLRQCDSTNKNIYSCYQIEGSDKLISADDYANDHSDPSNDYVITNPDDPICISPFDETTCGATGCNQESFTPCADGYICIKDDANNYICKCPAGTIEITDPVNGDQCVNPNDDEHCGASQSNPNGENCNTAGEHRKCNGIKCVCESGWVECNGTCINPKDNDAYCGVDSLCQNGKVCNSEQQCKNGICECEQGINCNDVCIDPHKSKTNCGARGLCKSDDGNSPNFKGIDCGSARCVVDDSGPKCECNDEDFYFDPINKECVLKNSSESCGPDFIDCRAKYHPNAKCNSRGVCVCPAPFVRLDDDKYINKYIDKQKKEGIAASSSLCVDINLDNRFCGENLETCQKGQMCIDGTCINTDKTKCEKEGRTLCGDRCINMTDNHMKNCHKCEEDWCSTELNVLTAGCNGKVGIGLNNCSSCLYKDDVETGRKCSDIYSACDNKICSCSPKETQLTVKTGNGEQEILCVNKDEMKIKECDGCTYGFMCKDGWGDCIDGENKTQTSGISDGMLGEDGCETNIHEGQIMDNAINNCGACGNKCSPQNVNAAICMDGICDYDECKKVKDEEGREIKDEEGNEIRYANCSGNRAEGCLTDLSNDENNCGVCGKICYEGDCDKGKCCWNNKKYSTDELNKEDCCPGTNLYKACDKNIFHRTRYTCASDTPTIDTNGWCTWTLVE